LERRSKKGIALRNNEEPIIRRGDRSRQAEKNEYDRQHLPNGYESVARAGHTRQRAGELAACEENVH
jgi:hypothetical protein